MSLFPLSVVALFLFLLFGPALQAGETTPYEQKTTAGQAFIKARNLAQARTAFAEASSLAPDEEARRWCELWLNVIPEKNFPYWSLSEISLKPLTDHLETELAPYAASKPRDEHWLSLKTRRATILSALEIRKDIAGRSWWDHDMYQTDRKSASIEAKEHWISWDDQIEIADYLEILATTEEGVRRYIGSLQQTVAMLGIVNQSTAGEKMRGHLQRAVALPACPDDAAWCRLACARALSDDTRLSLSQRDQYWADALSAAHATRWEKQTMAAELIWRIRRHNGPNPPDHAPQDLHAALLELKTQHQNLGKLGQELLPGDPYTLDNTLLEMEAPLLILNYSTLLTPGQPTTFSFAAANHKSLKATLNRVQRNEDVLALLPETNPAEERKEWKVPINDIRPGVWNQGTITLPALPAGDYVLTVEGEPFAGGYYNSSDRLQQVHFRVTGLSVIEARASSGTTTLFLRRTSNGEPVANTTARVLITALDRPTEKQRLDFTTDGMGNLQIPVTEKRSATTSQGEEITVLIAGEVRQFRRALPTRAYREFNAIIDNSELAAGKDVTVRILALNFQDDDLVPPSTPFYINATLNNTPLIQDQLLKFESDCLATIRLPIPANTKPENIILKLSDRPSQTEDENALVCSLYPGAVNEGYLSGRRLNVGAGPSFVGPIRGNIFALFPEDQELVSLHDYRKPWVSTARFIDGWGKPVSVQGEARLFELKWDEQWIDPSGTQVDKSAISNYPEVWAEYNTKTARGQTPNWKLVRYAYVATPVATQTVRSGSNGNITTKFKIPHPGIYQVQFWNGQSQLPCTGGFAQGNDHLDKNCDLTILALAPDTTDLALEPDYCRIFGPKFVQAGDFLTSTVIMPAGTTSNVLCFSGLNEARFQPFVTKGRVARIAIDHAPAVTGYGIMRLQGPPLSAKTSFTAPEPRLPRGMQRVHQSLEKFTHHRMALFRNPPSLDPEAFEIFQADEVSSKTGFNLDAFLVQIGKLGANDRVDDPDWEFKHVNNPALLLDQRIHPVLVGEEHGYCPEDVPVWHEAPL